MDRTDTTTKSALLIGCNYRNTQNELNGCVNDVGNIKSLLLNKFGFTFIKTMTDDTEQKPTRNNILNEFKNLLINSREGDTLFFSFSGHGSQTYDLNRDEADGMDETIISLDMQNIVDDELNYLLKSYMKHGVKLLALFDSCHSGTMLDLNRNNNLPGTVVMISGCLENQTSADAYINKKFQGAMTWSFIETIKNNSRMNWFDLVENMKTLLSSSEYTQKPVLSMDDNVKYQTMWL